MDLVMQTDSKMCFIEILFQAVGQVMEQNVLEFNVLHWK